MIIIQGWGNDLGRLFHMFFFSFRNIVSDSLFVSCACCISVFGAFAFASFVFSFCCFYCIFALFGSLWEALHPPLQPSTTKFALFLPLAAPAAKTINLLNVDHAALQRSLHYIFSSRLMIALRLFLCWS